MSYTYSLVKVSKNAEKYGEGYYQKLYRKICDLHIKAERGNELYRNPQEDLKEIDEYIADPDITEEERSRRKKYKENYIFLNEERLKRGTYFKFDQKIVEQKFAVKIQQYIELYKRLPPEM